MKQTWTGIAVLLGAVAFDPALAQEQTQPAIEEIVVQARRRAESLQDIPVSVTALDNDALKAAQADNLEDVAALVPNLTILSGRSGQDASIVIRGIGAFPFIYFDQGVGTYVDGIFLARQQGGLLDIIDIEQIEVLRGPQGTLFGKNTLGGALSITTAKPKEELEGSLTLRTGTFDLFESRAMLNVPIEWGWLEDRLFTRLSVGTKNDSGYTTNVFRDERYSDQAAVNFYGSALLKPADDFHFTLSGQWSRDHNQGLGGRCMVQEGADPTFRVFIDAMYPTYYDDCRKSRNFRFRSELDSLSDNTSYGIWGVLGWDPGAMLGFDDLSLRYTSAWRQQQTRTRDDAVMSEFPVFSLQNVGRGDLDGGPSNARQFQQEIQLNGQASDLNPFGTDRGVAGLLESWNVSVVAGAFGFWEQANTDQNILFLNGNPLLDFPPRLMNGDPQAGGTTDNFTKTDNWDWALFGQGVLDFTDWLSLTAGVRYTQEKKGLDRLVRNALRPEDVAVDFSGSEKFSAWTPMTSLVLRAPDSLLFDYLGFFDHLMGYFTYSRGFRGGGFNGGARTNEEGESFTPEFADMYELGLKTTMWERRLSLNASIYHIARKDQQVPQLVSEGCDTAADPNCLPPPTQLFIRNAATARARGFELEGTGLFFDYLHLNGSVGYSQSIFLDFPGAENALTGETINRAGQRQAFTPEWQANAAAFYVYELPEFAPDWMDGTLTPRLDWFYESNVENFAPEVTALKQNGYHRLNMRIGYLFNEGASEVALWGKNLTDTEYFKNSLSWPRLTGTVIRYYEPPRTVGIELSHRFN